MGDELWAETQIESTMAQYRTFQQAVEGFDLANHPNVRQIVRTDDTPQTAMTRYEAAHYCDWLRAVVAGICMVCEQQRKPCMARRYLATQ